MNFVGTCTSSASSQVKNLWFFPLYINPWPNRQNICGFTIAPSSKSTEFLNFCDPLFWPIRKCVLNKKTVTIVQLQWKVIYSNRICSKIGSLGPAESQFLRRLNIDQFTVNIILETTFLIWSCKLLWHQPTCEVSYPGKLCLFGQGSIQSGANQTPLT